MFLPAAVTKGAAEATASLCTCREHLASGLKFFFVVVLFSFWRRCEVAFGGVGGGWEGGGEGTVSLPFCPDLNPVVPVQRTCLFAGRMCVAAVNVGRRQATRHWHSSDSSNSYRCMFECVCVLMCVHVCLFLCVLCSTDLFPLSWLHAWPWEQDWVLPVSVMVSS